MNETDDIEVIDEPQEGDITTDDHLRFYCNGRRILSLTDTDGCERAVADWCIEHNYYPDCWWISDHGNAHRMTIPY